MYWSLSIIEKPSLNVTLHVSLLSRVVFRLMRYNVSVVRRNAVPVMRQYLIVARRRVQYAAFISQEEWDLLAFVHRQEVHCKDGYLNNYA